MNSIGNTLLTPAPRRWKHSKTKVLGRAKLADKMEELHRTRGAIVADPTVPRNGARGPARVSGTLSLWRTERPDHLTEHATVEAPAMAPLVSGAMQPTVSRALPTDAAPDLAAGRGAFETYGASGVHTNPHDSHSAERKNNWTLGFERAAGRKPSFWRA